MKKICMLLAVMTAPLVAPAQGFLGDVLDKVAELNEEYELDLSLIPMPSQEEWGAFWRTVDTTLQSGSMSDLAALLPYVETALGFLDRYPDAKPYGDWLRHQLDYFEVADEIVREERRQQPPARTPPPPPPKPGKITPPPPRPSQPAPASSAPVGVERWKKKLEGRPAPKASVTYVPMLKPVFEQEGVPGELVWLAEVESSFNPSARSPVGALGMYQFMPATAERFGLKLKPSDERLEPRRSAYAAAKYLKFLHGKFDSWPLALAAYNAGEGRVGRLLKKHGGTTFEDIQAYLPAETRMYVPKIDAVVQVREGSSLAAL